jgi:hypothetical protein
LIGVKYRFTRTPNCGNKGSKMAKHKVEFDAHKTVKKETEVEFTKRDGTPVDFLANKPTNVPVHVKFNANDKKRG